MWASDRAATLPRMDNGREPTGCRLVYPLTGPPQYVVDVLGTDPPPEGWEAPPPSRRRVAYVERAEVKRAERMAEMQREAERLGEPMFKDRDEAFYEKS